MRSIESPTSSHAQRAVAGRRRFLRTALALGGALGWSLPRRGDAASTGRVLWGFQAPLSFTNLLDAILVGMQGRYRPDLGSRLVLMPGHSGALAAETVLRAPADGSTVLVAPSAFLTLLPATRTLADDPVDHLVPVAGLGESTVAFIVGPAVPATVRTMDDYIRWVQVNPVLSTYGVPGLGTAMHFVAREVAATAGISLKAVDYRGPPAVLDDVVSGAVPAAFTVMPPAELLDKSPKVRMLAVASDRRWPGLPDVPTLTELKLLATPALGSLGFFVAEGTPAAKVDELAAAVLAVAAVPAIRQALSDIYLRPMPTTGQTYAALLVAERTRWIDLDRRVERAGRS